MKKIIMLLAISFCLFGMAEPIEDGAEVIIDTVSFQVNGMTCSMCSQAIEKKLKEKKTVRKVLVDFESKIVTVEFDKNRPITDKDIKDAIYYAGYELVKINRE